MNKIELPSGGYLCFDRGRFDDWCVYQVGLDGRRYASKDIDYFTQLHKYLKVFNSNKIYQDFVYVYALTTDKIDPRVIDKIREVAAEYHELKNEFFTIFCIIYMGMIAEENKRNTKLGKRIKRLGMYNLLVKLKEPEYCANFMKNKSWQEIDEICAEGGF